MPRERPLPGWPYLLRETSAAAYLDISPSTFRQLVRPQLRTVPLGSRGVGFLREDLERWVASQLDPEAASPKGNPWDRT